MKKKVVRGLLLSEHAGVLLRMRYATLTNDQEWLQKPSTELVPEPVLYALHSDCPGCLIKAMRNGDWSRIDRLLLGEKLPPPASHLH